MNNTERDALRRAKRTQSSASAKPRKKIADKKYKRSITQGLLMLLLMVVFVFLPVNGFTKFFLFLAMLLNTMFLFFSPFASITGKDGMIKVSRNMFYTDKFKISKVFGITNNGTKITISVKNYKHLVQFSTLGVSNSDGLRFIKDIEEIIKENNLEEEPKTEDITQRSFTLKNYKRKTFLSILMIILVAISLPITLMIESSVSYDPTLIQDLTLKALYFILLTTPFLLFISIWMLKVPSISIKNNIIYIKQFVFVGKTIPYTEIEKVESTKNKLKLYGKADVLMADINLKVLNKIQKYDFENTLNQIVEENKMLNQDK